MERGDRLTVGCGDLQQAGERFVGAWEGRKNGPIAEAVGINGYRDVANQQQPGETIGDVFPARSKRSKN